MNTDTMTVEVGEAQKHLLDLLARVASGTEIILAQDNTPRAKLVPVAPQPKTRTAGLHPGAAWTSDGFDDPLPEDFWVRPA